MCGICGFFQPHPRLRTEEMRAIATRMTDTLRHRGPDDAGLWIDPIAGIALGFRRLAILDLSLAGHQPMASACGRLQVVFNGEIYNFPELREEAVRAGYPFRGHSDTEVLLATVVRLGVHAAVERFNGMFALALWDAEQRSLTLARDRFGEKPLYYGWMGETVLFGSELKAMRMHPAFDATIDQGALVQYMRHNYVPAPLSIYQAVQKLPPGHFVTMTSTQRTIPEPVPYWSAVSVARQGMANPLPASPTDVVDQLDCLLRDAVRMRMVADVPLGAFLSGGVDSSTIVALMQAVSDRPVKTFSIGFQEEGYNEARYAAAVARHLRTDHTELYVSPAEARAVIPDLPTLYDEPFADASQIPTHLVAQLARRHVTVSLSGDGGDELFGGYTRYVWGERIWRRIGWLSPRIREWVARGLRRVAPEQWERCFQFLRPLIPGAWRQGHVGDKVHKLSRLLSATSPEALYLSLISYWNDAPGVVRGAVSRPASAARLHLEGQLSAHDLTQWMMLFDTLTYLPDDILAKVDRATMGTSLEARVPFLDPRVFAFAWRVPSAFRVRHGQGKWILRQVLDRYVPRSLIDRPKMGFGVPIGVWLRGPLREWAESLLHPAQLRQDGLFDASAIATKWQQHVAGQRNWQDDLWGLLMFQAWKRVALQADAAVAAPTPPRCVVGTDTVRACH